MCRKHLISWRKHRSVNYLAWSSWKWWNYSSMRQAIVKKMYFVHYFLINMLRLWPGLEITEIYYCNRSFPCFVLRSPTEFIHEWIRVKFVLGKQRMLCYVVQDRFIEEHRHANDERMNKLKTYSIPKRWGKEGSDFLEKSPRRNNYISGQSRC